MKTEETRATIKEIVDNLPQEYLLEALDILLVLQKKVTDDNVRYKAHIKLILEEDIELLKRLAQ